MVSTDIFFFFNDTATTEIYTLSLHDALPIWDRTAPHAVPVARRRRRFPRERRHCVRFDRFLMEPGRCTKPSTACRSEEHTSELQSRQYLVCRLLLEKKKQQSP